MIDTAQDLVAAGSCGVPGSLAASHSGTCHDGAAEPAGSARRRTGRQASCSRPPRHSATLTIEAGAVVFEGAAGPGAYRTCTSSTAPAAWTASTAATSAKDKLRGNVVPQAVQYERLDSQKGLEQGLEKAHEEIRGMHILIARARFEGKVSERPAALLCRVISLRLFGQVGDIVAAAEMAEELLARVADLAASEPVDGGFRSRARVPSCRCDPVTLRRNPPLPAPTVPITRGNAKFTEWRSICLPRS